MAPLQLVSREEQLRENALQQATTTADEAASSMSSLCVSAGGDWLNVCSSVDKIERLFQTELAIFARGSTEFRTAAAAGAHNTTSFSTLPAAADAAAAAGVRSSTDLTLPPSILAVVDFIGGINTPIHAQPRIASIGHRAMRHHARRSRRGRNDRSGEDTQPDDSCKINAAFLEFVPPPLVAAQASSVESSKTSLAPRVLDETQAGNEQVFVRFAIACPMKDGSSDSDSACAKRIRSFNFIVQPLQADAALREKALPVVAASLPLELAHCAPSETDPGFSVCEAIVPLSNYEGVWLTVQSVLVDASSTAPDAAYSCVRGPFFPRALVGSAALRDLYSIPSWLTAAPSVSPSGAGARGSRGSTPPPRSGLAIEEFMETFFNHRDLNDYLRTNGAPADGDEVIQQQPDVEELALPESALGGGVRLQPHPRLARGERSHRHRRHAPTLVGFNNETEAVVTGDEAQLDIQIVAGLLSPDADSYDEDAAAPVGANDAAATVQTNEAADPDSDGSSSPLSRIWMWNIPGRESPNPEEPFLSWLLTLSSLESPPLVHSISYGDMEEQLPRWYMQRINREFMKLALRGVTIIFPAGDKGVASDWEPTQAACEKHHPEFPVSSPFVLAVGATQFARQTQDDALCRRVYAHSSLCSASAAGLQEVACSAATGGEITTGGGFSEYWSRPPWQAAAVSRYLRDGSSHLPKGEGFFRSQNSRAYPDVSAMGTAFVTINKGQIVPAAGTSASVPLVAAIIALLNDLRLARGESPLGLVAPLLYSLARTHPHVFHDVTSGDNRCRLQDQTCCARGFKATKGWVRSTQHHDRWVKKGSNTRSAAPRFAHSLLPCSLYVCVLFFVCRTPCLVWAPCAWTCLRQFCPRDIRSQSTVLPTPRASLVHRHSLLLLVLRLILFLLAPSPSCRCCRCCCVSLPSCCC